MGLEPLGDVVGGKDGDLRGIGETVSSEHLDEGPRDGEDGSGSPRSSRDRVDSLGSTSGDDGVSRKEGSEMLSNTDRSNSGTSSSVRAEVQRRKKREVSEKGGREEKEDELLTSRRFC